ncbi:MAG: hypothetical protein VKK04_07355 [Synechococcales bacterium]|nr:hypothetical protein [Synechococcales bacterium]
MASHNSLPGKPCKGGKINVNLRPIKWTSKRIFLVSLGLTSAYVAVAIALISSGAVFPAIVLGVILAFCALMVGILLWFAKASL